jgi:glycosyltransferase involved in cell wall biosynthesis
MSVGAKFNKQFSPVRVCFISHSGFRGGAERALLETIEALTARGFQCYVVLPYKGPLCDDLEELQIPFHIIKSKPWTGWETTTIWKRFKNAVLTLLMAIPAAWRIKFWKCDLVYSNTITIWIGALAAALLRKPHIWHIHEFGAEDHGLSFLFGEKFSLKILNLFSSICIINSKAVAKKYKNYISPTKLRVVYYSMHLVQSVSLAQKEAFVPISKKYRCVIVGKVAPGKGQEDAVRAVVHLFDKGIDTELYIIGDGIGYEAYLSSLYEIVREYNAADQVHFLGYCDYPLEYMKSADVILMCSRCEAFGRVTVEGMLAGKPIIGARGGATKELVREGFNGLLYTPGDYQDLAKKITYFFDNRKSAREMGENGRRWAVAKFSQKRYGKELHDIILATINAK